MAKNSVKDEIKVLKLSLDYYLMELNDAITSGNEELKSNAIEQLRAIRERLVELKYYRIPLAT